MKTFWWSGVNFLNLERMEEVRKLIDFPTSCKMSIHFQNRFRYKRERAFRSFLPFEESGRVLKGSVKGLLGWSPFPSVEGPRSDILSRTRFSVFLRISFGVSSSSSRSSSMRISFGVSSSSMRQASRFGQEGVTIRRAFSGALCLFARRGAR